MLATGLTGIVALAITIGGASLSDARSRLQVLERRTQTQEVTAECLRRDLEWIRTTLVRIERAIEKRGENQ